MILRFFYFFCISSLCLASITTIAAEASSTKSPKHSMGILLGMMGDSTGLNSGLYQEYSYGMKVNDWFSLDTGYSFGSPKIISNQRGFVFVNFSLGIPIFEKFYFTLGYIHNTFLDIKRGDNIIVIKTTFQTKYLYFVGGIASRSFITDGKDLYNPFIFQNPEMTLLFDIRFKYDIPLKKVAGSYLRLSIGASDFDGTDILTSNTVGYNLYISYYHQRYGFYTLNFGTKSYSFFDGSGYFGRNFISLRYIFEFK